MPSTIRHRYAGPTSGARSYSRPSRSLAGGHDGSAASAKVRRPDAARHQRNFRRSLPARRRLLRRSGLRRIHLPRLWLRRLRSAQPAPRRRTRAHGFRAVRHGCTPAARRLVAPRLAIARRQWALTGRRQHPPDRPDRRGQPDRLTLPIDIGTVVGRLGTVDRLRPVRGWADAVLLSAPAVADRCPVSGVLGHGPAWLELGV